MKIVIMPQHLDGISAEVAILVFVVERPGSDLGPRRLPPHVLKVFFTDRAVDGAEGNVLIFAHPCSFLAPTRAIDQACAGKPGRVAGEPASYLAILSAGNGTDAEKGSAPTQTAHARGEYSHGWNTE